MRRDWGEMTNAEQQTLIARCRDAAVADAEPAFEQRLLDGEGLSCGEASLAASLSVGLSLSEHATACGVPMSLARMEKLLRTAT